MVIQLHLYEAVNRFPEHYAVAPREPVTLIAAMTARLQHETTSKFRNRLHVVCDYSLMNPRTFVTAAAVALLIVAGFLLHADVHATTPAGGSVACGTVWAPDNADGKKRSDQISVGNGLNALAGTGRYEANQYVGYEAACSVALDSRGGWGWTVGGVALVVLLGAVLIRRPAAQP